MQKMLFYPCTKKIGWADCAARMIKGPNHSEEVHFSPATERLPRQTVPL